MVESTGLENRKVRKGLGGSNPPASAANMRRITIWIILAGIAIAGIAAFFVSSQSTNAPLAQGGPVIRINDLAISVEIADSPDEWNRGLSGRAALPHDRGMLFIFPKPGIYPFWMPNMHFPIDIIWIGQDLRIVDITMNVPPDSYPQRFSPRSPAQYVLEVHAGFAAHHNIKVGDSVTLP